jgi:hypothetical protein
MGWVYGAAGHLIVSPNGEGQLVASRLIRAKGEETVGGGGGHGPCFDHTLGSFELKCLPVVAERMWLRRGPFLEGQRASHGQCGLKRRGWRKKKGPAVARCSRLAGRRGERRRTNSRVCWNVGPQLEEKARRQNSHRGRERLFTRRKKTNKKWVTRRDDDRRGGCFQARATDLLNELQTSSG